jgi:hypothetical protein
LRAVASLRERYLGILFRVRLQSDGYRPAGRKALNFVLLLWLAIFSTGCAVRPYHGVDVDTASFLERAETQQQGNLRVTAAVPDAAETEALTGLDLYEQGIQPVWLKVENTGSSIARVANRSVDKDYFSPIEVAYKNRKKFSSRGYEDMQRWFHGNGLERRIPPGESRSGLVFTNLKPGTKGFNLDIFSNKRATSFTFFLPLPGFTADYTRVDFDNLYPQNQIRQVDEASLKTVLEQQFPCCATDDTGELNGGPINLVLVGTPLAVRRSLLRGDWQETSADQKLAARSREHLYRGRQPDTVFYLKRADGNERLQVNLWAAPLRVGPDWVWVGQVFYRSHDRPLIEFVRERESLKDSKFFSRFVGESVSADIDSAQRFILQHFWYNHSLLKAGYVAGAGVCPLENPCSTFDGVGYFTDGERVVMFLSETPVALDDGRIIYHDHVAPTDGDDGA